MPVPRVRYTGIAWRLEKAATPPIWSSCSWVTTMPAKSEGERPRRSRRSRVSAMVNPQSIITRVLPLSTTSPLPELPLPRDAKRSATLLELVVEQRQDLLAGARRVRGALRVLHGHLRHARARVGHVDAELRLAALRRVRLPELELVEEPGLILGLLRRDVALGIDVAHEEEALRAVAVLDGEADAVEREAHAPPGTVEAVVHREAAAFERGVARHRYRGLAGARDRHRLGRGDLRLVGAELYHYPLQHLGLGLAVRGPRLPDGAVLVGVRPQLLDLAVAHEDLGRTGLGALLQPGAVLVAPRRRPQVRRHLADRAAHEVLRDLRLVLVPFGLEDAGVGLLAHEAVAGLGPEVAHHRPHGGGFGLHHQPALVAHALQPRALDLRQHGARVRAGNDGRGAALGIGGVGRLRLRIGDGETVVDRGRRELGRNLERLHGARLGALVLLGLGAEAGAAGGGGRDERGECESMQVHGEAVPQVRQPAARSAPATVSWCAGASGVSGRRMPSAMRPMRCSAHLTGMGLDSTKRCLCSPSNLLLIAIARAVSPERAATHISCISRGATLAVTETTPLAPSWTYASAVSSLPLNTMKSLGLRARSSVQRSMLEVASLIPTMPFTCASRRMVSLARSATVREGTL